MGSFEGPHVRPSAIASIKLFNSGQDEGVTVWELAGPKDLYAPLYHSKSDLVWHWPPQGRKYRIADDLGKSPAPSPELICALPCLRGMTTHALEVSICPQAFWLPVRSLGCMECRHVALTHLRLPADTRAIHSPWSSTRAVLRSCLFS